MNREVTEAIEFLQWLLDGIIKFYPDHPLFSRTEVDKVSKGEDKWADWDARKILGLARRSLELSDSTPLNQVISRLQNLVENPSAVNSLPEPILAKLREEEHEIISPDSPQEKRAKLETISRRSARARYGPRATPPTEPSPKLPTPPEAVGFVDVQAPADISTLRGATEKAFIDEVVQTLRRERPEIEEGANLEQLRETATQVVRQMEAEGKGGATYKINATAFSRAITDRGRLAEVLVSMPSVAEVLTKPPEKKVVHLAPESPLPTPPPEVQQSLGELITQVKTNKETFVRDLSQKIEESHPEFSQQQAEEAAGHIATRIETYSPETPSEEAALASVALNPELFERSFPGSEVRAKILDEAVRITSERQWEEQIAKQVLPVLVPEAKEAVVEAVYQPTKQRFIPTPEGVLGPVSFEPQGIIERIEQAPQKGFGLAGTMMPSATKPLPPAAGTPQETVEFLSQSAVVSEQDYKPKLAAYIESQIVSHSPEELKGLTQEQIKQGALKTAGLVIENTPAEIKSSSTPIPITLNVPGVIESLHQPSNLQAEAISASFKVFEASSPKEAFIQVPFTPSVKPAEDVKNELASKIADQINALPSGARIDPQSRRELTPTEVARVSTAIASQAVAGVGPTIGAASAPVLLKIETPVVLAIATKPPEDLSTKIPESFKIIESPSPPAFPARAVINEPGVVREQVFVGVAEKFAPGVEPELRARVESLAKTAAADPERFQSQLSGKLISNVDFTSQFTTPEQIAVAADGYSKDLTDRLLSVDKGVPSGPSLAEIASSPEALDKTFAVPAERQRFVSAVSEKETQIGRMTPVIASALGIEEGVLKATYQPRPLVVTDALSDGISTISTKKLLPAAVGEIPFSEAIIPPAAPVSLEGGPLLAKPQDAAQELGIKISYAGSPEALPPKISELRSTIQNEGFVFNQRSPEDALPLFVFASGVSSGQFQGIIAQAQDKGLGNESVNNLENFLLRLKALEETSPDLFKEFQKSYPEGSIQLSFVEYTKAPGVFAFVPSGSTYALGTPNFAGPISFNPGGLVSKGLDKLFAPAKKKISESLAQTAAGKTLKAGATKIATKVATKAGVSTVFSNIAAAIGTAIGGPVGALIGKIVGWILTEVVGRAVSFFKRNSKKMALALVASGVVLILVGAGLPGGLLVATGFAAGAVGEFGSLAATAGGIYGSAMAGLGVVLPSVVAPVIIALFSVPLIIVLILFIVNSGAYLVPPNPESFSAISNPYIDISKTADRTEFENSELPETVTYTIEIVASRGSLTNIRFQTECRVIRAGAVPSCPPVSNVTVNGQPVAGFPPTAPGIISPADDPYTITYQQTFSGNSFFDALVSDTFTIIADVPEQQDTQAAASAGVRIGDPPDECPNGWPILPYASEGSLLIIQGPRGLYTHTRVEAIDVTASIGHPLTATHTGTASAGPGGVYGTSIRINSSCGGRVFSTIYGHLTTINVSPGETVVMGQSVGTSGITGTDNAHLHYEFSPSTSGIPMAPPYIPKSVPYGCYYRDACGVTIP